MGGNNKTIVVSGCTKGIGRAVCDHFAAAGFNVAGYARSAGDVAEMKNAYASAYPGQQFLLETADASVKSDVVAFAAKAAGMFGDIEVLVNNAGVFLPGSIMSEKDGTLEKLISTNLYSAYYLTRALEKNIRRNIFNICSIASLQPYEAGASYTISKFAMLGFSKQLRHELTGTGVKVTAVMPGAVLTDSWKGSDLPSSRFIQAADIASTIYGVYCLSDGADVEEVVIRPQQGDI